jgi:hypothetical protein
MIPSSLDTIAENGSSATTRKSNQQQQGTRPVISLSLLVPSLIISFAFGYYAGGASGQHKSAAAIDCTIYVQQQERKSATSSSSRVIRLQDVPLKSTSHVYGPQGRPIAKQQLVDPFTLVNNLAGISVTSLLPGQSVTRHAHDSMHEFFYILDGDGLVDISNSSSSGNNDAESNISASSSSSSSSWMSVSKGSLVYAAEREAHAFHVPENASQPMQMIFFGLTTNDH